MITTVTLNASIDKAYVLDGEFVPGTVMRVKETRNTAGGKGLNVARVAKICGSEVTATGFVGGFNGDYLEFLLKKSNIQAAFTHIKGETRSCINVLEGRYKSTEFLEPGCQVEEAEVTDFIYQFCSLLTKTDIVTLSGSLPKGVPVSVYATLIDLAKSAGKKVLLDSSGVSFQEGLNALPTLVKPNQDEIEDFFNVKIQSRADTVQYAKKIADKGIEYVVVSLGSDGAIMVHQDKVYQGIPPKITPINTVGCGDSMVAAFAVGLEKNFSPVECLTYAIAVGTANALSPFTGDIDPTVLATLQPQVKVQILS